MLHQRLGQTVGIAALLLCGMAWGGSGDEAAARKIDAMAGKATGRVIYTGVNVIDGKSDQVRANMAVIVSGERIEAVVPLLQLDHAATEAAEIVDMHNAYVLPGLIDSHVHYGTHPTWTFAAPQLKRDIYGGITTVRDMAGDARFLADLGRQSLINAIPAPDIAYAALVAGPVFFQDPRTVTSALGLQSGNTPWMYAVTEQSNLAWVLAQARGTGATGLKIYADLPGPLVRALIVEAHHQHFPVWTHLQVYPATPYDSLGADSVSHVCMIARYAAQPEKDRYGHSNAPSYVGITAQHPEIKKYLAALARSGTILDATLSVYADPPPGTPDQNPTPKERRCSIELAGSITHAALQAGVPVVAGTDENAAPDDPYPQLDREMDYLVRYAGMRPADAIIAATATAARALGKAQEIGTLEPGKLANLMFVKDDPTADIGNLHTVLLTVKRGLRFARADYVHQAVPDSDD